MKKLLLLSGLLCCALCGMGQTKVDGVVTGTDGKPVKGVKIRISGLFKSVRTNGKGVFKLSRVLEGDTLLVYPQNDKVAKLPWNGEQHYKLTLNEQYVSCADTSNESMFFYADAPMERFDGNIITARQIQELGARNLIDLLRGNVAGLQVVNNANGTYKAVIRGGNSFELSVEPLFIVGGTEYETLEAASSSISVEDIQEVEVLKDGSEYGMKGSNGVIIVHVKGSR